MQTIGLLVNTASGKGNARKLSSRLQSFLVQKDINFSVFEDNWPAELNGFTEIWLVGGDGTVNYFINRYPNGSLPFAIFKGGTGNDLAWKLYGALTAEEQAERVLQSAPQSIDCGECNGRLYANSLGIGFDGEVLRKMGAIRWLGGHLGYLWAVIGKILTFREFTFSITAGDSRFNGKYLLVIVNNSSRTGGGFLVTPKASLQDGKLDLVLCNKLSVLKRLRYLPVIEKGKHTSLPFITYIQEGTVHIACEKEVFGQIDGDLISGESFDIRVIKDGISVLY